MAAIYSEPAYLRRSDGVLDVLAPLLAANIAPVGVRVGPEGSDARPERHSAPSRAAPDAGPGSGCWCHADLAFTLPQWR